MDQSPLEFVFGASKRTLDDKGAQRVWIACPSDGLTKRQATLILCFGPGNCEQPKPAIIFHGKGEVQEEEDQYYDKNVHVYFQDNAWTDANVAIAWAKRTWGEHVAKARDDDFLLFLDNLPVHNNKDFLSAVAGPGKRTLVWFGLPICFM